MSSAPANDAERVLWRELRDASRGRARDELVRIYDPLARSIAARVFASRADRSITFDDCLQYGRLGLLEAIDRFDPARGVAFGAYSGARIRGAILNGLARESEAAANYRFRRDRVRSVRDGLVRDVGRASLSELAAITLTLAVGALLEGRDEMLEPEDPNPANNPYFVNELGQLASAVRGLLPRLPQKEHAVITGHYVEQLEFRVLAQRLALTQGRISQIHARGLARLRDWLEERPKLDSRV